MSQADDEIDQYVNYLESIVGNRIVTVHEEDDSVWLHLSDESVLEIFAAPDGGFGVEIHLPTQVH